MKLLTKPANLIMKKLLIALVFMALQNQASAINMSALSIFDCHKPETQLAKELCADDDFTKIDEMMKSNYLAMIGSDIGRGAKQDLVEKQKNWKNKLQKCKDSNCVKARYVERVNAICEYPVLSGIYPVCDVIEY